MDIRLTWTDCDEAGDYVVPNVLSPRPRDLHVAARPDNMDKNYYTHRSGEDIKGFPWKAF